MRRTLAATAVLSGTLMAGTFFGTGVAVADEADTCEAYASVCPTPSVEGTTFEKTPPVEVEGTSQSNLPFTGGEIALMSVAGIGAIGAGTAFVIAGRRKKSATA